MLDIRKFTRTLVAVAALGITALPTSAAVVTWSALPTTAILNPVANPVTGTVFNNVTGSVSGVRRSPWLDAPAAETGVNPNAIDAYYTSISANSSATFAFGGIRTALSFVWGSPDTYNVVEFLLGGNVVDIVQLTGTEVIAPATFGTTSATATFTNIVGGTFDAVRLKSPGANAFEVANIAAVPLPAAGFLLIGALGGLAVMRRRKTV